MNVENRRLLEIGVLIMYSVHTAHTSIAVGKLPIICMHISDDAQISNTIHMINLNVMVRMISKAMYIRSTDEKRRLNTMVMKRIAIFI